MGDYPSSVDHPEQKSLRQREEEITNRLNEIFGSKGDTPFGIELNSDGEIVAIQINQVDEGRGRLGEILQQEAQQHNAAHRAQEKAVEGSIERNDTWLIEAYKTNPEVKATLD